MIHAVKDFDIVDKSEVDVFLEHSCFFDDPMDVDKQFIAILYSYNLMNCIKNTAKFKNILKIIRKRIYNYSTVYRVEHD